ncbi:hypothetical protein SteCoe_17145 [Stentor coeruleus]|uniref:Uncharacterized protein n=1 Tax=Stentor coeruleus TaxID=5963 RepID=A0A1R2BZH5_9CILI|nr:hypothetical protein SteCoe_17145 [Stentor coeruleus]
MTSNTKKEEIDHYKKLTAESVRQELKAYKSRLAEDTLSRKALLELESRKISEMELKFSQAKEKRLETRRSSDSQTSNYTSKYLDHLKSLQIRAKELLKSTSIIENFPEPPQLESKAIIKATEEIKHIRVPVMIPKSILRKTLKEKPPAVNKIMKNGEIMSIHLLTDGMPAFDPLVKAEAKVMKSQIGMEKDILADISCLESKRNHLLKSVSPIRHKVVYSDLTPPEYITKIRQSTPKEKFERHNFRENNVLEKTAESHRSWVSERMKSYSQRIKDVCKPQVSVKKQIEMQLLKEKLKRDKPFVTSRIKLENVALVFE